MFNSLFSYTLIWCMVKKKQKYVWISSNQMFAHSSDLSWKKTKHGHRLCDSSFHMKNNGLCLWLHFGQKLDKPTGKFAPRQPSYFCWLWCKRPYPTIKVSWKVKIRWSQSTYQETGDNFGYFSYHDNKNFSIYKGFVKIL